MHDRGAIENHRVTNRKNRLEIHLIHLLSFLSIVIIHAITLFFLTKSAESYQLLFSFTRCTTAMPKKITAYAIAKTTLGLIPSIRHTVLSSMIIYPLPLSYLTKSAECFTLFFARRYYFIYTVYIQSIFWGVYIDFSSYM